ncbi:hypothetical protein ACIQD3_11845 [Peribacillus loiseleuriae]|uniref:hypothetical protein n=1 Tax=Peribacillus loiseleuriae TaxID=1679170 RepID=UPI00380FF890
MVNQTTEITEVVMMKVLRNMSDLQIKRRASFLAANSHVLGIFLYEGQWGRGSATY